MDKQYVTGGDFLQYDKDLFNKDQLMIIEQSTDLGITPEQANVYIRPDYHWEQMYEMQQGYLNGLTIPQVQSFADVSLSAEEMHEKRKELEQMIGFVESEELLISDMNIRDLLQILKSQGKTEEEGFHQVITEVDVMSALIQRQGKIIRDLESEVRNLKKPSLRERATEISEALKRDYNELKSNLNDLQKRIKEGSKFLVDVFRNSGEMAFFKAFEQFSKGLKDTFQHFKSINRTHFERTEKSIEKTKALKKEAMAINGHLKNIGRILIGKKPQDVEQEQAAPSILQITINNLERHNKLSDRMFSIYDYCMNKMEGLEKSFGEKAKERKSDLNTLISNAASELKANEKEKSHQKENDRAL